MSGSNALKESLQLLSVDTNEFADFAIDSDDEAEMDNIDISGEDVDISANATANANVNASTNSSTNLDIDFNLDFDMDLNLSDDLDPLAVFAKTAQNTSLSSTKAVTNGSSGASAGASTSAGAGAASSLHSTPMTTTTKNVNTLPLPVSGAAISDTPVAAPTTSIANGNNSGGTGTSALKKKVVSATEDPLSMTWSAGTSSGTNTNTTNSSNNINNNGASNFSSSYGNTNANTTMSTSTMNGSLPYPNASFQNNTNSTTKPHASHYPTSAEAAAAASQGVAKIVSKTQSFTSTFSSFASKFSDAVSNATATTNIPMQLTPGSMNMNANSNARARAHAHAHAHSHHGNMNINNSFSTATSSTTSMNTFVSGAGGYSERSAMLPGNGNGGMGAVATSTSNGNSGGPTVYGAQNVNAAGNASAPSNGTGGGVGGSMEHQGQGGMDKATKSAVLNSALGKLIPGERVIMFLSGLQNVQDSSSPQSGFGSVNLHQKGQYSEEVWCCAMTFYRLIIFSYRKIDFAKDSSNLKTAIEEEEKITQWEKSASVSRQFQILNNVRSVNKTNEKYHQVVTMPLACIDRVEKSTNFSSSSSGISFASSSIMGNSSLYHDSIGGSVASGTLVVYGKDNGRFIKFTAPSYADCMGAYQALNTYSFPGRRNLGYLFAFESRRDEVLTSVKNGEAGQSMGGLNKNAVGRLAARAAPRRYDALLEFQRMINISPDMPSPWRPFMKANAMYNSCPSYPSILFGPSSINDETPDGMRMIRDIAAFRSGQRFQTLSWASKHDGASIWRCAQPKVGLQGNRNASDELYIKKIGECAAFANTRATVNGKMPKRPSVEFLNMLTGGINAGDMMIDSFETEGATAINDKCMVKILDLRPKSSAVANRTAGYGYENTSYYKNTTLSFHGIGNIHAVRDAYQKLSSLCLNLSANDVQWAQLVEETKWLSLTRLILSASWQAAFHVRYNRMPVILHCSHGWDRTSQVCALSQIFLDSHYRTRAGFSCLVEKDFLALGHPFHLRCAHGEGRGDNNNGSSGPQVDEGQRSPIFIQFLDCVFQIVNQYPDYFEFNTKYLLLISEHVYSCRFGTLLCDTEKEREVVASVRQRTHCLWEYLDSSPELVNKNYVRPTVKFDNEEDAGTLLMPLSCLLRNVTLWSDRFCMHGAKPTARCFPPEASDSESKGTTQNETNLQAAGTLAEIALRNSQNDAARWKKIAKDREEEIFELKQRLKGFETENQILEETKVEK